MAAGTRVSVHHYATYHSSSNFEAPNRFAPERWLGDTVYSTDRRESVQPFSFGPRNCLGQNMAMHEMRLILARVFFSFDLYLCDDSRQWIDQRAFVLWAKKPLMCQVKQVA